MAPTAYRIFVKRERKTILFILNPKEMAIPYKVVAIKNPGDPDSEPRYYPRLITMGQSMTLDTIAYEMKESSSLSAGDIKSVLTNFVFCMRRGLYNGHSVNIAGFGVFSLASHSIGVDSKEKCSAKLIKKVSINFRASSSVRPSLTAKNEGDVMTFVDVEKTLETAKVEEGGKG